MGDMATEIQLAIDDISDASSQRAVDLLLMFVKQVQLKLLTKIEAEVEMAVDGLERKLRAELVPEPKALQILRARPALSTEPKDDHGPGALPNAKEANNLGAPSSPFGAQQGKHVRHAHTSPLLDMSSPAEASHASAKTISDGPPWAQINSGTSTRVMFAAVIDAEPLESSGGAVATDGHAKTSSVPAGTTHVALAALSPSSRAQAASSATMAALPAWASASSHSKSGVARGVRGSVRHVAPSEMAPGSTTKSAATVEPHLKPAPSSVSAAVLARPQATTVATVPDAPCAATAVPSESGVDHSTAASPTTAHLLHAASGRLMAPAQLPVAPVASAASAELSSPTGTHAQASEATLSESAKRSSAPAAIPVRKRPTQVTGPEGSTWRCHPVRACSGPEVTVHASVGREMMT